MNGEWWKSYEVPKGRFWDLPENSINAINDLDVLKHSKSAIYNLIDSIFVTEKEFGTRIGASLSEREAASLFTEEVRDYYIAYFILFEERYGTYK